MNREEVIEYIQEWLKDEYALNGKDRVVLNMAIKALQQERPKGEWINDIRYPGWTCTNCGFHDGNKTDNFCPNCGADMREKESEE